MKNESKVSVVNWIGERVPVKSIKALAVHGGMFHADDVMCYALLKAVNPDIILIRINTFNEMLDYVCGDLTLDNIIVCDVLHGHYDHHQDDCARREDGEKRAACGILFDDIKSDLFIESHTADEFENTFIIPIEDADNGIAPNPLNATIRSFNPQWNAERQSAYMDAFIEASEIFSAIINNKIEAERASIRAYIIAEEACKEAVKTGNNYIWFNIGLPWMKAASKYNIKFAVLPSPRGGYALTANSAMQVTLPIHDLSVYDNATYRNARMAVFDKFDDAIVCAEKISEPDFLEEENKGGINNGN